VLTNEDPLNIVIGNSGLKPQFRNTVNLSFFDYKVLTERYIWANISYNHYAELDQQYGIRGQLRQADLPGINVNGDYSFSAWLNYYFKWKGRA